MIQKYDFSAENQSGNSIFSVRELSGFTVMNMFTVSSGRSGSIISGHSYRQVCPEKKYSS